MSFSVCEWWSYTATWVACSSHAAPGPRRSRVCASTTPTARTSLGAIVLNPRIGSRCLWYARKRATSGFAPRGSTTCVGSSGRCTDHSFASATALASESKSQFVCVSTTLHGSSSTSPAVNCPVCATRCARRRGGRK